MSGNKTAPSAKKARGKAKKPDSNEPGFLEENMKDPKFARRVLTQLVAHGLARQLMRVMDAQRVTKAELGARIKRTEAEVSALLADPAQMTIGDLSDLAQALGFRLRVGVEP